MKARNILIILLYYSGLANMNGFLRIVTSVMFIYFWKQFYLFTLFFDRCFWYYLDNHFFKKIHGLKTAVMPKFAIIALICNTCHCL